MWTLLTSSLWSRETLPLSRVERWCSQLLRIRFSLTSRTTEQLAWSLSHQATFMPRTSLLPSNSCITTTSTKSWSSIWKPANQDPCSRIFPPTGISMLCQQPVPMNLPGVTIAPLTIRSTESTLEAVSGITSQSTGWKRPIKEDSKRLFRNNSRSSEPSPPNQKLCNGEMSAGPMSQSVNTSLRRMLTLFSRAIGEKTQPKMSKCGTQEITNSST